MTDDVPSKETKGGIDVVAIDIAIRLTLVGLLAYWSLLLIGPFITIVTWGVILAVALFPTFEWLRGVLWGKGVLTAVVMTIVFLLIIIGPVSFLAAALAENVTDFAADLEAGTLTVAPPGEGVKDWPVIGEKLYLFWSQASVNLQDALATVAPDLKNLATAMLGFVANVGLDVLKFIASVIIAGCLFVPGLKLAAGFGAFAERISAKRGKPFVALGAATIRNVARGVIGISLIQSLLLGVGMLVAGVPAAGILTLICLFLGIIQIGPAIVIIGTLIWAWAELGTVSALIFTVYMIPATFLDNVLKPIVMSRGLSTPMLVIFIGVIGGTMAHGLIGLFIGPIVLAVAYELIVFWVRGDSGEGGEEPSAEETDNASKA